jgi:hypothetical protein
MVNLSYLLDRRSEYSTGCSLIPEIYVIFIMNSCLLGVAHEYPVCGLSAEGLGWLGTALNVSVCIHVVCCMA